jgi:hypothetical protein
MSWTISLQKPENESLLERYFVAVGKALCIATNFEDKCYHVLRMHRITNAIKDGRSEEEVAEISTSFNAPRLYDAIEELAEDDDVSSENVELLHDARGSRNHIAHEAGSMDQVWGVSDDFIFEKLESLIPHVRRVAEGENLVSIWTYEMSEREPAPSHFGGSYTDEVLEWIFGDLTGEMNSPQST